MDYKSNQGVHMTSKQEKKQMLDYLVSKLINSETIVQPVESEIISGIKTRYISLMNKDNLESDNVILIDREYPKDSFSKLYSAVKNKSRGKIAAVLLKDGKTFFRNAAEANGFKQRYGLSLRKYSAEETHRMIQMRPEELFLEKIKDYVQYYQPKSERLKEAIVTCKFEPVKFDYGYRGHYADNGYELENKDSTRIMIHNKISESTNNLKLEEILPSQYPKLNITKANSSYLIRR